MRISELIEKLKELKETRGDLLIAGIDDRTVTLESEAGISIHEAGEIYMGMNRGPQQCEVIDDYNAEAAITIG